MFNKSAGLGKSLIPLFLCLLSLIPAAADAQEELTWEEDILGEKFEMTTLTMPADYEGDVEITLIRSRAGETTSERAVLYVHGFNDYFFQDEMAARFNEKGYDFYAVDLRKYGRSWREHQRRTNVRDLSEYYADIDTALSVIRENGAKWTLLAGHSTGGLTTTLYTADNQDSRLFDALWLNSPFYAFNEGFWNRNVLIPLVTFVARFSPDRILSASDEPSKYSRSIHVDGDGEWDFDREWKTENQDITLGWLRAVHLGHKRVASGVEISVPVMVMHSDKTIPDTEWSDAFFTGDAVLNVDDIRERANKIESPDLTVKEIEDGLHDLILSRKEVREKVYEELFDWLNNVVQ